MKKLLSILFVCSLLPAASVIISPNMNLPVPIVSQDTGPDWANNINSCMNDIDQHNHTPGKGVPIPAQAININSSLPLNNNPLTMVQAIEFSSQGSFSPVQSLYVESPDLFYNDGNGNIIRITQNGSVAGASGTITGLPSGTASASYQSGSGTFQFQSATNTPANITGASITIAQQTATPNGITLKSPNSLAASYNVTFPTSLPSFPSLLAMSTSGVLSTVPYSAPTVQRFTSTGSGTYTLPTGPTPLYIRVQMVGPGGGGGSQEDSAGLPGTANTTFGTTFLSAGLGSGGDIENGAGGGAGGTNSIAAGPSVIFNVAGAYGQSGINYSSQPFGVPGGSGGSSFLGGAGNGAPSNNSRDAINGSGSGGSGAGGGSTLGSGSGGGAGGYVEVLIANPSSSYAYVVGAGGGGGAGTGGRTNGGRGGDASIVVTEYYQ